MRNLTHFETSITRSQKEKKFKQKGAVLWLTGLSGSGKSTLANALDSYFFENSVHAKVLDGDNIRLGLNKDLGFSLEDRKENIRRISEVAKLFADSGIITIVSFISPIEKDRLEARSVIGNDFVEVFLDVPLATCEERDPKGLYKKAREGVIKNFTGIASPYEAPSDPEIRIDGEKLSLSDSTQQVISFIREKGFLS